MLEVNRNAPRTADEQLNIIQQAIDTKEGKYTLTPLEKAICETIALYCSNSDNLGLILLGLNVFKFTIRDKGKCSGSKFRNPYKVLIYIASPIIAGGCSYVIKDVLSDFPTNSDVSRLYIVFFIGGLNNLAYEALNLYDPDGAKQKCSFLSPFIIEYLEECVRFCQKLHKEEPTYLVSIQSVFLFCLANHITTNYIETVRTTSRASSKTQLYHVLDICSTIIAKFVFVIGGIYFIIDIITSAYLNYWLYALSSIFITIASAEEIDDPLECYVGSNNADGMPMKLSDLQLNAELLGITVISILPEAKNGFRYILIDSDSLAVTARKDIDVICLKIQDNTASCGDNSLFTATKAKRLGFESYIYVKNGHAVTLVRYDEKIDLEQILQMITTTELQEDTGLWKKYFEVMTGNILYLGNSKEAILQEFSKIIKNLDILEDEALEARIETLLVKIDSTNTTALNEFKPVLHGLLVQFNEYKELKTTLDTNNLDTLYNKLIIYITESADTVTEIIRSLLQPLLFSVEAEFLNPSQSSANNFPPFYPPGQPEDEPNYESESRFDGQNPNNDYAMLTAGNNSSANYSMVEYGYAPL